MHRSPPTSFGTHQLFLKWHNDQRVKLDDSPPSFACSCTTIPSYASMACCLIKYLYNVIFAFSSTWHVVYSMCTPRPVLTPPSQLIRAAKLLICVWQVADSYLGRHSDSTAGWLYLGRKSCFTWYSALCVSSWLPFRIVYLIPVTIMRLFSQSLQTLISLIPLVICHCYFFRSCCTESLNPLPKHRIDGQK
jgi:hypothetical protein